MTTISKLLRERQLAFWAYSEAREAAFVAANYRDTTKAALKAADTAIQNFLRTTQPS